MPNHVTNILTASADVIRALKGKKRIVDFNALIPMPKLIAGAIAEGTAEGLAKFICGKIPLRPSTDVNEMIRGLELSNVMRDIFERGGIKSFRDEAGFENFITLLRNYRSYGHFTWYDWAIENWGTKWNAYDCKRTKDGMKFETAWSAPHPVIAQLVRRFPDEKIVHRWADEDIGNNLGHRVFHLGSVTDIEVPDPIDFALTLNVRDRDGYAVSKATGKWEYVGE